MPNIEKINLIQKSPNIIESCIWILKNICFYISVCNIYFNLFWNMCKTKTVKICNLTIYMCKTKTVKICNLTIYMCKTKTVKICNLTIFILNKNPMSPYFFISFKIYYICPSLTFFGKLFLEEITLNPGSF